jgi:predicted ATP-binding protein involved in virulence
MILIGALLWAIGSEGQVCEDSPLRAAIRRSNAAPIQTSQSIGAIQLGTIQKNSLKIETISVSKLFGIFDHEINLNLSEGITIIFGPNGFGKTVLLTLIDAFFNEDYQTLRIYPFTSLTLVFNTRERLSIFQEKKTRADSDEVDQSDRVRLTFQYWDKWGAPDAFEVPSTTSRKASNIEKPTVDELLGKQIGRRLSSSNDPIAEGDLSKAVEPDWLKAIRAAIPVHFIETERLQARMVRRRPNGLRPSLSTVRAVERYSQQLAAAIQKTLTEYASLSDQLDRAFPKKLVSTQQPSYRTRAQIEAALAKLDARRSELMRAGLLDQTIPSELEIGPGLDDARLSVLGLYLDDIEEKFRVFDRIASKIDFLKKVVSERFLYKQLTINKEKGMVFETISGTKLPLTSLSSGEQHELILLYRLLFEVSPNSLVLIDEPEMSLHIAWQELFLRDLSTITRLSDFDVIVATHSPEIISDRWDLTLELKRPAAGEANT